MNYVKSIIILIKQCSTLRIQHIILTQISMHSQNRQQTQVSLQTFAKVSILVCLVNLLTISRLHMFDETIPIADKYFHEKSKLNHKNQQSTPSMNNANDFMLLFTEIRFEDNYLLPFLLELSAIIIVVSRKQMEKVYRNLIVIIVINCLCFFAIWTNMGDLFIYRITYIIQGLLIFPTIVISAFGLTRLIPRSIINFKGYYACLMFLVPYLGVPIAFWYFDIKIYQIAPTDILHKAMVMLMAAGFVVSLITFFILFQGRNLLRNALNAYVVGEINQVNNAPQAETFGGNLEKKIEISLRDSQINKKQSPLIFEKKQNNLVQPRKLPKMKISKQNFQSLMITWAIVMAIGKQLPELKKSILGTFTDILSKNEVFNILNNSSAGQQFKVLFLIIIVTLAMVAIIRRKKLQSLQITVLSIAVGYSAMIILFVAMNKIINPTVWLVTICLQLGRIFFMAFVIPSIMLAQQSGMQILKSAPIIFLLSWAIELIFRVLLVQFQMKTKIFILAMVSVVCCYFVEKIGKQSNQHDDQDEGQYGKVGQQMETQVEIHRDNNDEQPQQILEQKIGIKDDKNNSSERS